MARRRKKRSEDEDRPDLNLTPMMDVIFNLLIFFLCSPFRVAEGQLDAFLPKDIGPNQKQIDPSQLTSIKIKVKHRPGLAPQIIVGRSVIPERSDQLRTPDFNTLAARIESLKSSGGKEVPVEIEAEPMVKYEYIVLTLNACTKAKAKDIRFSFPMGKWAIREKR